MKIDMNFEPFDKLRAMRGPEGRSNGYEFWVKD
jgi:hypothetical protein